jgi:hypothetical protein
VKWPPAWELVSYNNSVVGYVSDSKDSVKTGYQETSNEDREDFMCAVVTVIFGVCNSVRPLRLLVVAIRKVVNKSNYQSEPTSKVTHTHDSILGSQGNKGSYCRIVVQSGRCMPTIGSNIIHVPPKRC